MAQIPYYNRRMTPVRAIQLNPSVTASLQKLVTTHQTVDLVMEETIWRASTYRLRELTARLSDLPQAESE